MTSLLLTDVRRLVSGAQLTFVALGLLLLTASLAAQPAAPEPAQGAASPQTPGRGDSGRGAARGPELWWRESSPIGKELGLAKDQTEKIETLFQETRPSLNRLDNDLQRRESMLSNLIKDDSSELIISQYIDKVEKTRSDLVYIPEWTADLLEPWDTNDITIGVDGQTTTASVPLSGASSKFMRVRLETLPR